MSIETDSVNPTGPARPEDLLVHAAWVRGVAHALVRDAATADDLVQETWLAALRRPPETGRPLRPWLGGVVRNLVRQRRRGEARRDRREEAFAARRSAAALPTPAELAERLETQESLAVLVKELPEPFKATVLLRYFEGISAAEIATREGVPAGTVRWRLKRGMDLLRERLDAEHDGDRRAWVLALCPIAVSPDDLVGHGSGGGLVAAVVQGVVAMGVGAKILMGGLAVVAALAVVAVSARALLGGDGSEALPDEPVSVSFRPESVRPERRHVAEQATAAGGVTPDSEPTAEEAIAPLRAPALVEGRTLDKLGAPISGVLITDRHGHDALTAEDGRFVFSAALPDGLVSLELRFQATGRATAVTDVPVSRGETSYAGDIELQPGGTVSGVVVGEDGRPIVGAWVGLASETEIGAPYPRRRRMRRWSLHGRDTTETDASGAFTLTGVPTGSRRVWTGSEPYLATLSGPVEVRTGIESYGVELVLEELAAEDVISGRVVAPDGTPLPTADLRYEYDAGWNGSGSGSMEVARDGTFRLILTHDTPHSFMASDSEGRWGGVSVADVAPGSRDVVLRLPEKRYVDLVVTDRAGAAVTGFEVSTNDPDRGVLFDLYAARETTDDEAPESVRIRIPAQTFHIEVELEGFDTGHAGPFDPDAMPEIVRVTLDALPGLRGVVTAAGARVAGADVSAHAVIGAGRSLVHNGFATRWQPSATASTRTDANGAYTLTLREPGAYVVRVTAADHAPLEIGPFTYDTAAGRSGVDARLTQGGSIQGVVRVDAGRSPAGMIVGISRGDGHAVSQRVGPDGRFRFDRLMPGEWEVRRLDEDITAGASSSISTGGEFVAKWSCSVRDGEITHFDLGARRAAAVRLTAEVMVDGDGAAGWSLSLMEEVGSGHKPVASATVGYAGDAEIEAPGPGDYRILLTSPNSRLYVLRDMTLVGGDNRIDVTLRLGRVSVQGVAPPSADAPDVELSLVWFGDDGWFALMPLIAGENGVATVAEAPAGQMTVRRLNRGAPDPDPATWEIVRELTVPGDGSVDVSLDGE